MIRTGAMVALTMLVASSAYAQVGAAVALRGRIGIDEGIDAPSVAIAALDRARVSTSDVPIFVRLHVDWTTLQRAAAGQWSALDDRLDAYGRRSVPVLLAIGPSGGAPAEAETWAPVIRAVASHLRGRVAGYQIEAATGATAPSPRDYAFQLKLAAVQIRASDPGAVTAQATARPDNTDWLRAVYAEGTAAYVDLAPIAAPDDVRIASAAPGAPEALIVASDPSAERLWVGASLGDDPSQAVQGLLTTMLAQLGDSGALGATFAGSVTQVAAALTAAALFKDLVTGELVVIEDRSVSLTIEADGRTVTTTVPHRLVRNVSTGGLYLAYWGDDPSITRVTVSMVDWRGGAPTVRDPVRRDTTAVEAFSWDATTKVSRMTARLSPTVLVLDFNDGTPNPFVSRADVTAVAVLSVEEIVARHQQAQTAQANAFKTFIASLRMEIFFRPSPTQVFNVVSDNRFYFGPDAVEWEELSFSVNGTRWGPDHPGLPLLQAEKVLALPLDLRLTADYRYRLDGMDTVGGRRCYVVAFEPSDPDQARYRGRVWIDAGNFLRIKVQSIQTHLEGPIVSNEDIALYEPVPTTGGSPVFLATRLSTTQTLLIAGRNLLLQKEQWFSEFRVDAPDFEAERRAARASERVMFRDTDAGVRYLIVRGGDRVVSNDIRTSSKAMAMGTTIDPTFAFPLPILGLNYLNFDVKGTGSQLALLFGGVFALGNLQTPKLGRTPFDASVDFFGIAVPGTDLRFDVGGERKDERVLTIPMSTGVNLGYQFTPFQKVNVGYALRYDAYFNAPETAADFLRPSRTATHGASVEYQYSRRGYRLSGSAARFTRTSWERWGRPGDFHPEQKTYRRHSVGGVKDFLIGPFQSIHLGATWYGGSRLDRFSMYQFGLFDEVRMHGVPAAGIRFPELVLIRGSYSFNLFGVYRLDLFVDHARGRDPNDRATWRPVTGTGAAVTLKTPWNTMFTADVGKSLIPDIYRGTGSFVLQLLLLKPL